MSCKKIMKFKWENLLSARWLFWLTLFIFLFMNFNAIVNSGILMSGGSGFNAKEKYTLIANNFTSVSSLYGLLLAICLGAGMIGPDLVSGNIYVILSAYPSRKKYYIFTCLVGWLYFFITFSLLTINYIALLVIFEIELIWSEIAYVYLALICNASVIFFITAIASIYMKGYKAVVVGILAYVFYSIYTFNTIPIVNAGLSMNIAQGKDIMFYFMPMTYVITPSVNDSALVEYYQIHSFFHQPLIYQSIYSAAMMVLGSFLFHKKDL